MHYLRITCTIGFKKCLKDQGIELPTICINAWSVLHYVKNFNEKLQAKMTLTLRNVYHLKTKPFFFNFSNIIVFSCNFSCRKCYCWLYFYSRFGVLLQVFSPVIRVLLTNQSLVDAIACLFAVILLVQPVNWIPGVYILDTIICHVWQGQHLYWAVVWISGQFYFLFKLGHSIFNGNNLPLTLT